MTYITMMTPSVMLLLCLVALTSQKSTVQEESYVAAVVEYEVTNNVEQNVENYLRLIREAAEQEADIVVFPEMTLTIQNRAVKLPVHGLLKEYAVPAQHPQLYDEILVNISATALNNQIYVLVNLQEEMDCANESEVTGEDCPEKKVYLFNTNVVFDRSGAVIDRYRKINLFGEYTRTPAIHPDLGLFTTDFGVTFGHFICFDLMFQVPAVQVVEKYNLTDVVFSTMWFSEMPYLTAVQIQEAYAHAMGVNFIAAGANNVRVGSAGSGIYSGKAGALVSIMPGVPTTRLLVARVPKVPGQVSGTYPGPIYDNPKDHDSLVLISDPSLPAHVSRQLVPGFQEFTLVDKEVTCRFRVRLNQREGETIVFRAFAKDGKHTYSRREIGVTTCSVVACKNDSAASCGYKYSEKNVIIEELQINMSTYRHQYNNTLQCDNILYFPVSLQTNKFPLSPKNFTYIDKTQEDIDQRQNNRKEEVILKLNAPQNGLISFAVWGRVFTKDVDHNNNISIEDIEKYKDIENIIYGTKHSDEI